MYLFASNQINIYTPTVLFLDLYISNLKVALSLVVYCNARKLLLCLTVLLHHAKTFHLVFSPGDSPDNNKDVSSILLHPMAQSLASLSAKDVQIITHAEVTDV